MSKSKGQMLREHRGRMLERLKEPRSNMLACQISNQDRLRVVTILEAALRDARAGRLSPDSDTYRALVEAGMVNTKGESDGIA